MQIKKFIAPTLKEAAARMKDELGDEAVIISTRIKEDKNGAKVFEVVAGVEDDYDQLNPEKSKAKPELNAELSAEVETISKKVYDKKIVSENKAASFNEILNAALKNKKQAAAPIEDIQTELKRIVDLLYEKDVTKTIINDILDQLKQYKDVLHKTNIESYLLSCMSSMIQTQNFELKKTGRPFIISLVGPTGVGKTTCIAKLAVISKILHNLNVGLISIDTYRLGALDQLKIFSEVSNIDMQVAYEPSDLPTLLNNFKKKDVIFIDTAGRSQKNAAQLNKNQEFFRNVKVDQSFLVLSAASSLRTLYDVIEKFKIFNYDSLIFTKLDETPEFGNMLNVCVNKKVKISFLANGQVIPDDIISADADFIANLIYTGKISR